MIFIAPRSLQAQDRMWFFHSIRVWRDERTGRLVVMWRRSRFLGLVGGLLFFFYFGFVAALTWWLEAFSPGLPITYVEELNPIHWFSLPRIWNDYQRSLGRELDTIPENTPRNPAAEATTESLAKPSAAAVPAPPKALDLPPVAASSALSPLLTAFFAHNGGTVKLHTIQSIKIRGNVTLAGGNPLSFTLVKKLPDKVRLNIHDDLSSRETTLMTDGNTSWKATGDPYQTGIRQTTRDEIAAVLREALYTDVPVQVLQHLQDVTEPANSAPDDHHFFLQMPYGMRARITPDRDTWLPSHLEVDYQQGTETHTYVIVVHDWTTVEGVPEPATFAVTLDGQPLLEGRIESITFNLGVYDILFQPPPEAPSANAAASAAAPGPATGTK